MKLSMLFLNYIRMTINGISLSEHPSFLNLIVLEFKSNTKKIALYLCVFSFRIHELLNHISAKYSSTKPFVTERKNFGLIGVKLASELENGFTFFSFQKNVITLDGNNQEKFVNSSFKQFISIPFEAINMSRSNMVDTVIIGAVYSTDKLFVKRKDKLRKLTFIYYRQQIHCEIVVFSKFLQKYFLLQKLQSLFRCSRF